jgi:hypothetical protein
MVEAALEIRPRMVLLENVPGMQSARKEKLSFLEAAGRMLEERGGFNRAFSARTIFGDPRADRIHFLVGPRRACRRSRSKSKISGRTSMWMHCRPRPC